jgi:hypothetical protein
MTVGRLLQEMSSSEFTEWAAYLELKHRESEKAAKKNGRR